MKAKSVCWLVPPGVHTALGCQEGLFFSIVPQDFTKTIASAY